MESQRQAFHPSPRPWKSRKIGGIPTFPPLRPLIPIYKVRKKPVRNHQPWVGQIKLPKWANFSCQKHFIAPLGGVERKLAEIRVSNTYFLIPSYLGWCPDSHCVVVANSAVEGRGTALFAVSL